MQEVLKVEGLSISFGGLKAVDDLSFTINEGQIFGLIGPNGAGKTTAFNCITQFYKADTGVVDFTAKDGKVHNLRTYKVHDVINLGLVRTFQNVEIIKDLTIIDNIMLGAHSQFKSGIISNALRLPKARREERELRKKAMEILEFLGIKHLANFYAVAQPYGVLKLVELGRTLMCNPRLIILDEPAAGLNDSETALMSDMIRKIRDDYNCSILLVEHDMGLVMSICDKICAISFGKKLAEGTPEEIQNNKDVQEAYLGKEDD